MVDSFTANKAPYAIPHRKPLPSGAPPPVPPHAQQPANPDTLHSRTRTVSSGVFPASTTTTTTSSQNPAMNQFIQGQPARRTLSNATTSTSSSGGAGPAIAPVRTPSALRRSPSASVSSSQVPPPTSYVALMRKQKATVWSERAQHEDPRLLAAQRQAKMRAAMEVVGGPAGYGYGQRRSGTVPVASGGSGSFAGGVRSKIRHHGAQKAVSYNPIAGAGVPMRLSANEVDEGSSDEEQFGSGPWHRRTGSGRSSLGSDRRHTATSNQLLQPGGRDSRYSSGAGSTPPNGSARNSSPTTQVSPLNEEASYTTSSTFFEGPSKTATGLSQTTSSSSGGSRENSFGQLGSIPDKSAQVEEAQKKRNTAEDLMRRGSVDERSMTMSGVRLFVANPDLD